MAAAWPLKRAVPFVDRQPGPLYDCPDPYPDEGELSLELPGPRSRYEQLAAQVRKDIYDGRYPPDSKLPREIEFAGEYGVSRALANRALQMLGDEELITQVQGSGTTVRPRRVYRVIVQVPRPADRKPGNVAALRKAIRDAATAEPAIRKIESVDLAGDAAEVRLLAEAADGDWAVRAAKLVVRAAGGSWSWAGWDLTLASYRCAPAGA